MLFVSRTKDERLLINPNNPIRRSQEPVVSHKEYCESPHWKLIHKLWVESGYPRRCIACGSIAYELHHINYGHLYHEHLSDLLPLCREHHEGVHEVEKNRGIPISQPETALALMLNWSKSETDLRFAEIHECWRVMPRGKLEIRARLFARQIIAESEIPQGTSPRAPRSPMSKEDKRGRALVQCRNCGKRGWQTDTACSLCGADCEIVFDWR
jgi:hypothetical protein